MTDDDITRRARQAWAEAWWAAHEAGVPDDERAAKAISRIAAALRGGVLDAMTELRARIESECAYDVPRQHPQYEEAIVDVLALLIGVAANIATDDGDG